MSNTVAMYMDKFLLIPPPLSANSHCVTTRGNKKMKYGQNYGSIFHFCFRLDLTHG
jgi:hypothetical protein